MKVTLIPIFLGLYFSSFGQGICVPTIKYGDNPSAGKVIDVNGIKMYYETYGNPTKQPLILVHGNGGSISRLRCQIEYFKSQFYVIAADSRYHGKSGNGTEILTYDLMAKDYNSLLTNLKIDSAYFVGISDGGIIGLFLAMDYPKKIKRLVATGPNLQSDSSASEAWFIEWLKTKIEETDLKINSGDKSEETERLKGQLYLMDRYLDIKLNSLSRIKVPVLIMAGDEDAIKLEHIIDIYHSISKAQLFIMPGATHFMNRYEYILYNQISDRFLNTPFKRPTTKELFVK